MSLKACRECGAQVSEAAKTCPNCGISKPVKKGAGLVGIIIVLAIGVGIISSIVSGVNTGSSSSAPPAQKSAAQVLADHQLSEAAAAAVELKKAMRNPDSFQLSEVLTMPDATECLTYRAQNGFGGLNVEKAVIHQGSLTPQGADRFNNQWNRYCAGRSGTLITDSVNDLIKYASR